MKWTLLGFIFFLCGFARADFFTISQDVLKNSTIPFLPHNSYLIMNVNYSPVKKLVEQINNLRSSPLKDRGESHITVITPVEFQNILNKKLSIAEINALAKELNIQNSKFEMTCVGKGSVEMRGKEESTFYIVVKSPALISIRRKIQEAFLKKGGPQNAFVPENYFPHITLGFTKRDLHESDGIVKNEKTCFADIKTY